MAVYFVGKEKGPEINMMMPFGSMSSAIKYAMALCKKKKLDGLVVIKVNRVSAPFVNQPPRMESEFLGEVMPHDYWEYDDNGMRVKKPYPSKFIISLHKDGGRDRHMLNADGSIGRRL